MLAFTQKSFGKQNEFFILNTHAVVEHATVLVLFFYVYNVFLKRTHDSGAPNHKKKKEDATGVFQN